MMRLIKRDKAYRNLAKIYHFDLTLFDKEENTVTKKYLCYNLID
ncbi:MAG: Unknown protein [uncultured Sulfurovum sp.]|uniref:Uncharacterized protein n=1 Tax=uncultured Sulfurovum sp. TaxID=269237 RepID=A0A6S6UDF6_9BACT|nr:MAG: Unknown protein [uncultured Sulfurovum sp.]